MELIAIFFASFHFPQSGKLFLPDAVTHSKLYYAKNGQNVNVFNENNTIRAIAAQSHCVQHKYVFFIDIKT